MERALYKDLLRWKASSRRKPLLLRGARQVGKTFLLRQFGERQYDRTVYCNFEEDPALDGFFRRDLNPRRILDELAVYKGLKIEPQSDLLIFDEVQASNLALVSLKYFQEEAKDFHIAAAGSLLGIQMSQPGSFPVGKVSFLDLHPMTFVEFSRAMGRDRHMDLLKEWETGEPIPEAIHQDLFALLRQYYFTGGMPEVVDHFRETGDALEAREIQREILDSYTLDFAKHAPTSDIPKLGLIWESIPLHLAKENRKFMFSVVKKGARAREYENALRWLHDAGLVRTCHAVSTPRTPMSHYSDRSCFKIYPLDVGLLGAMANTPSELAVRSDRLFTEYRGALAESYVAQQLVAEGQSSLFYWRSTGGKAEIDFLCESQGKVLPVEVKAGASRHSKSLRSYDRQFEPELLVRTNLLNLRRDGKILNIPLYAISFLPGTVAGDL